MIKDINEQAKTYMNSVKAYIAANYNGTVPTEFNAALEIIETNYRVFLEARNHIENEGTMTEDFRGNLKPNPALSILKDSQNAILKVLLQFGLTSYSRGKLKHVQDEESEEDLINELLG